MQTGALCGPLAWVRRELGAAGASYILPEVVETYGGLGRVAARSDLWSPPTCGNSGAGR